MALRQRLSPLRVELRYLLGLRALPPRVALFMWRARRRARRRRDVFSLASAIRPQNLALLLELARGRRRVVELGTGTGWSTLALALDDRRRRVTTFDPALRPELERYAELVAPAVAARITYVAAAGVSGPRTAEPVDLLYIDSSHERQATIDELAVWGPRLLPGTVVVFDDYAHPGYPGVREAVAELGLDGEQRGTLFVWVKPSS
jgi:predicted O-methyltransferase YrrM